MSVADRPRRRGRGRRDRRGAARGSRAAAWRHRRWCENICRSSSVAAASRIAIVVNSSMESALDHFAVKVASTASLRGSRVGPWMMSGWRSGIACALRDPSAGGRARRIVRAPGNRDRSHAGQVDLDAGLDQAGGGRQRGDFLDELRRDDLVADDAGPCLIRECRRRGRRAQHELELLVFAVQTRGPRAPARRPVSGSAQDASGGFVERGAAWRAGAAACGGA